MFNFVFIMLLLSTSIFSLEIDNQTIYNELLSHSKIYIDYNKTENIKTIETKNFKQNNKKLLGFGYSPDFNIWIKFKLTNSTNNNIHKIIEYNNPLTSYIQFFENKKLKKEDGLLNIAKDRISLNPIFKIKLNPYETKEFYIKAYSKITTLIVKLNLWSVENFYEKEMINQVILALFFGAMGIIILYNITIFLATKELSYLYYILFFISVSFHHLMYKGVANLYIFPLETIKILINYSSFIVALPTIFLALFTQQILKLKQYPRLNRILKYLLIIYPIVIIIIHITNMQHYRSIFFIITLLFLFFITCYAFIKKNKQAHFIIIGWILFVTSGTFMYFSSKGIYDIFMLYPYYTEFSLIFEVTIFSLALASRIRILNQKKIEAEKNRLLLKELNHRVKNSMQTILSFLILEKNSTKNREIENVLINLENRILATTELYSLLHTKNNITVVNMSKYFYIITENIKKGFKQNNIDIAINTKINMNSQYAIYCGLIINEAVTNSFKYAFINVDRGRIEISLNRKENSYHLKIKDNGKGFKKNSKNGLGLDIIDTLASLQLDGTLEIKKNSGVEINIIWRENK